MNPARPARCVERPHRRPAPNTAYNEVPVRAIRCLASTPNGGAGRGVISKALARWAMRIWTAARALCYSRHGLAWPGLPARCVSACNKGGSSLIRSISCVTEYEIRAFLARAGSRYARVARTRCPVVAGVSGFSEGGLRFAAAAVPTL